MRFQIYSEKVLKSYGPVRLWPLQPCGPEVCLALGPFGECSTAGLWGTVPGPPGGLGGDRGRLVGHQGVRGAGGLPRGYMAASAQGLWCLPHFRAVGPAGLQGRKATGPNGCSAIAFQACKASGLSGLWPCSTFRPLGLWAQNHLGAGRTEVLVNRESGQAGPMGLKGWWNFGPKGKLVLKCFRAKAYQVLKFFRVHWPSPTGRPGQSPAKCKPRRRAGQGASERSACRD